MDNFRFHVTSQGDASFDTTLRLALSMTRSPKVSHYAIDPERGLALFWHDPGRGRGFSQGVTAQPLPYPMDRDALVAFVSGWLRGADYGQEPDHDGSNGKGWTIYTDDSWGHVWGSFYGIVAVKPTWALYGK